MPIAFNRDKCNHCLLCVRDCTSGVLRSVDGKPAVVEPDWCSLCGHCIAVCPRDAVMHDGLAGRADPVHPEQLQPEIYRAIVLGRRSVRHYRNTPVPRELIEQLIDLSRYAPTASNDENVGYVVVTDRALIRRVAGRISGVAQALHSLTRHGALGRLCARTGLSRTQALRRLDQIVAETAAGRDFILHHAPVLILLYAPRLAAFARDNCSIAATTLINYAHSLGLGTCFIGYLTLALRFSPSLRRQLGVPRGKRVHATLVLGYPAYAYARTAPRKDPEVVWKS